jgi:DNA-binding GntR family transcriptional regulator
MGYLEALCAGLSAVTMRATERETLDALHNDMATIVHAGDAARYAEANDAFHGLIYAGAHNAYLGEITHSTRQRLSPFRRAQFAALGRLSRSHAEHAAVVEAILRGDRAEAEAAMRRHISIVENAYQRLERGTEPLLPLP